MITVLFVGANGKSNGFLYIHNSNFSVKMPTNNEITSTLNSSRCISTSAHETCINLNPLEDFLSQTISPGDLIVSLTDLLIDYSLNHNDGNDDIFRDNVGTIALLIDVLREVDRE